MILLLASARLRHSSIKRAAIVRFHVLGVLSQIENSCVAYSEAENLLDGQHFRLLVRVSARACSVCGRGEAKIALGAVGFWESRKAAPRSDMNVVFRSVPSLSCS